MMEHPTDEEVRKVHRWECMFSGHRIECVSAGDQLVMVLCSHCDTHWRVEEIKREEKP